MNTQAYHIFPDPSCTTSPAMTVNMPPPSVSFPTLIIERVEHSWRSLLRQEQERGATTISFAHLHEVMRESMQQAEVASADIEALLQYAVPWFETNPA